MRESRYAAAGGNSARPGHGDGRGDPATRDQRGTFYRWRREFGAEALRAPEGDHLALGLVPLDGIGEGLLDSFGAALEGEPHSRSVAWMVVVCAGETGFAATAQEAWMKRLRQSPSWPMASTIWERRSSRADRELALSPPFWEHPMDPDSLGTAY